MPSSTASSTRSDGARRKGRGQATLEFALVLPFVALVLLAVAQTALVVRAQVLVTHAAREGARAAAVDADPGAARHAALASSGLDHDRLDVEVRNRGRPGERVEVQVRYRLPTDVPLVGPLMADLELEAEATMRVET